MPIDPKIAKQIRELTGHLEETRQQRLDLVVKAFEKGATVTEISKATGMSTSGLSRMLAAAGARDRLEVGSPEWHQAMRDGGKKRWT